MKSFQLRLMSRAGCGTARTVGKLGPKPARHRSFHSLSKSSAVCNTTTKKRLNESSAEAGGLRRFHVSPPQRQPGNGAFMCLLLQVHSAKQFTYLLCRPAAPRGAAPPKAQTLCSTDSKTCFLHVSWAAPALAVRVSQPGIMRN